MIFPGTKVRRGERGVILPLAATVLVAAFAILVALAIDTKRVKEAQAVLAAKVEGVCHEAGRRLPIARQAVRAGTFPFVPVGGAASADSDGDVSNGINFDYAHTLFRLSLMVPFPERLISNSSTLFLGPTGVPTPYASVGRYLDINTGDESDCVRNSCLFAGAVTSSAVSNQFSTGFFRDPNTTRIRSNGVVACDAAGEVTTFLSGKKTVNARAAYQVKIAGPTIVNATGAPINRGLTIGIAPQVDTIDDGRFEFNAASLAGHNPLASNSTVPWSQYRQSFTESGYPLSTSLAISPTETAALEQAKMRCYNPMLAVRNGVVQGVMARLGRLWSTRNNTQLLVIQSQSRETVPIDIEPNLPVEVIAPGKDILAQDVTERFQMPYVNYQPGDGWQSQNKYLCPRGNGTVYCDGVPSRPQLHMAIVSQLRDCFFVMANPSQKTFIQDTSGSNVNFEFSWMTPANNNPFNFGNLEQYWGFAGQLLHRRSGEEIVQMMSTVEECPYAVDGWCEKPGVGNDPTKAAQGLRPDIVPFLEYVLGIKKRWSSPGYLGQDPEGGGIPSGLPAKENPDITSQVLLVLQKRIDPALCTVDGSECARIRDLVDQINNQTIGAAPNQVPLGRKIILLYVPTTAVDADPVAVQNLRDAFLIGSGGPNSLITIMPSEYWDVPQSSGVVSCGVTPGYPNDAQCFRDYWEDLLINGGFSEIARTIWEEFTEVEVAL